MSEERAERRASAAAGGGTVKKCFKNSLVFCFYGYDARGFFLIKPTGAIKGKMRVFFVVRIGDIW